VDHRLGVKPTKCTLCGSTICKLHFGIFVGKNWVCGKMLHLSEITPVCSCRFSTVHKPLWFLRDLASFCWPRLALCQVTWTTLVFLWVLLVISLSLLLCFFVGLLIWPCCVLSGDCCESWQVSVAIYVTQFYAGPPQFIVASCKLSCVRVDCFMQFIVSDPNCSNSSTCVWQLIFCLYENYRGFLFRLLSTSAHIYFFWCLLFIPN